MTWDYVGFGSYLRSQRETKQLSVEEVASKTKISPTLVGALETGHAERFPERVFVLNYIRSYAGAVGLDPDEVVRRFQQIPEAPRQAHFDPAELERDRRADASTRLWLTLAVAALAISALALNAMYELALRYTHR